MTHQIRLWFRGYTDNGGKSDKVYVITIVRHSPSGYYAVNAEWGRRGGKMSFQNKGMYASHWSAVAAFNALAGEKMAKGYESTAHVGTFNGDRALA